MENVKETIAKNILLFRKRRGLSQKALANKIGVVGSAISNWENGVNSIDIDTLYKVCVALDVDINEMFGVEGLNDKYLHKEKKLLKDYRLLDTFGREIVNCVIAIELKRLKSRLIDLQEKKMTDEDDFIFQGDTVSN